MSRKRAFGVFLAGVVFALVGVWAVWMADGDLLAVIGSPPRRAPVWFLLALCAVLAVTGVIGGVVGFVRGPGAPPKRWTTRRIFDEDGKRIHYDDN